MALLNLDDYGLVFLGPGPVTTLPGAHLLPGVKDAVFRKGEPRFDVTNNAKMLYTQDRAEWALVKRCSCHAPEVKPFEAIVEAIVEEPPSKRRKRKADAE